MKNIGIGEPINHGKASDSTSRRDYTTSHLILSFGVLYLWEQIHNHFVGLQVFFQAVLFH